jgi:hypothetical protein
MMAGIQACPLYAGIGDRKYVRQLKPSQLTPIADGRAGSSRCSLDFPPTTTDF